MPPGHRAHGLSRGLLAAAGGVLLVSALALVVGVRAGRHELDDWHVSLLPEDKRVPEFVALFRRGGFAAVNDGFIVWRENDGTWIRSGLEGLPPLDRMAGVVAVDLSIRQPAPTSLLEELLSLERAFDAVSPPESDDAADDYEYFVYITTEGKTRKYRLRSFDMSVRNPSLTADLDALTGPLW